MERSFYRSVAAGLAVAIGSNVFFNGSVVYEADGIHGVLRCTLLHGGAATKEGKRLAGWIPVWWEFVMEDGSGSPVENDFSWEELCLYGD